jgi:hypothetical protein
MNFIINAIYPVKWPHCYWVSDWVTRPSMVTKIPWKQMVMWITVISTDSGVPVDGIIALFASSSWHAILAFFFREWSHKFDVNHVNVKFHQSYNELGLSGGGVCGATHLCVCVCVCFWTVSACVDCRKADCCHTEIIYAYVFSKVFLLFHVLWTCDLHKTRIFPGFSYHTTLRKLVNFFILVPCIFKILKFFSPTNAY